MQKEFSKSQFKAKALEVLRQVEATGESIIVTDHGKPAIEVRPWHDTGRHPLDLLKGSVVEYHGPFDPVGENDWEAMV